MPLWPPAPARRNGLLDGVEPRLLPPSVRVCSFADPHPDLTRPFFPRSKRHSIVLKAPSALMRPDAGRSPELRLTQACQTTANVQGRPSSGVTDHSSYLSVHSPLTAGGPVASLSRDLHRSLLRPPHAPFLKPRTWPAASPRRFSDPNYDELPG